MPLLFGPKDYTPGWMRTSPAAILGTNLSTRFPMTWQRDPGITSVKTEDWGSPGTGYSPSGTHMATGPFSGYSRRAVALSEARRRYGGSMAGSRPIGGGEQPGGQTLRLGTSAPSRYAPKRLWDYQLTNLAPSNTTLGRMRNAFSGFNSPMLRA